MHRTIRVTVKKKIATAPDTVAYVCGNGDFTINFNFDTEWDAHDSKTARFIKDDKTFVDVVFQGTRCSIPVITDSVFIYVGVFAGNLCTTTPAVIRAKKSILCDTGTPAAPPDDVYNQIMERLDELEAGGVGGGSINVTVDDDGNCTLTGATLAVDSQGNATVM